MILSQYYERPFKRFTRKRIYLSVGIFAFFYGFFFALTTIYLLVQLVMPLVMLALLVIWLLPETGRAPIKLIEQLFFAFIFVLLFWPDYMAVDIPPLPWLTAMRIVVTPLALALLLGLSQSSQFRKDLGRVHVAAPAIGRLVLAFGFLAVFSTVFSEEPFWTLNKSSIALLYWVMIFYIAAYVFSKDGRLQTFFTLVWLLCAVISVVAAIEFSMGQVPWANHIPNFLKIEDPAVIRSLAGSTRAYVGIHRVQSKFTTPLGLAEFLSCATPIVLYFVTFGKNVAVRMLAGLTLPLILFAILYTDARLGMVGFFSSLLLFALFWGTLRWKFDRNSLLGPSTVLAFPAIGLTFFVASFFIGRLRNLVWGTGAQTSSNDARVEQMTMGIPKIIHQPWGYGMGRSGAELGFVAPSGQLTVDNYFLTVALDFGILGLAIFLAMFLTAIWKCSRALLVHKTVDADFLMTGPIIICMANFLIIKSVFSQIETHPFFFAVLGAAVALIYRLRQTADAASEDEAAPSDSR